MARSLDEWIGATPDTPPPPRVRLRVFDNKKGCCHSCGRKIRACDRWTCEHLKAIINGGENRERNLDLTCEWCLPGKNASDVAEKSKVASIRKKHVLPKQPSRGFHRPPGTRFNWCARRYEREG